MAYQPGPFHCLKCGQLLEQVCISYPCSQMANLTGNYLVSFEARIQVDGDIEAAWCPLCGECIPLDTLSLHEGPDGVMDSLEIRGITG